MEDKKETEKQNNNKKLTKLIAFFCIIGIILGVLAIMLGAYILFNVYSVFSVVEGQMYDGFGTSYGTDGNPNSPYSIIGFISLIAGGILFKNCFTYLKSKNKDDEFKANL